MDREGCAHLTLTFGSGDYYVFCHACGASWVTVDRAGGDKARPDLSNKGVGCSLSGQERRVTDHPAGGRDD